jgi:hypothetical protein
VQQIVKKDHPVLSLAQAAVPVREDLHKSSGLVVPL